MPGILLWVETWLRVVVVVVLAHLVVVVVAVVVLVLPPRPSVAMGVP